MLTLRLFAALSVLALVMSCGPHAKRGRCVPSAVGDCGRIGGVSKTALERAFTVTYAKFPVDGRRRIMWHDGVCHVDGDIAGVSVAFTDTDVPDQFVLAFHTSPGMPPRLEGLELRTADRVITLNQQGTEFVKATGVANGAVYVTILRPALELAAQDGLEVFWVDYYR